MLKKLVKVLGLIVVVILVLILLIPFIFKKQIDEKIKEEINNELSAKVDYTGLGFSMLAHFPHPTISLDNFVIVNQDEFNGDTLLSVQKLIFSVNLQSVLRGANYQITSLHVTHPEIKLRVNAEGHANWNIARLPLSFSKETRPVVSEKRADFAFRVSEWKIEHGCLSFQNDSTQTYWGMNDLATQGKQYADTPPSNYTGGLAVAGITYRVHDVTYLNYISASTSIHFYMDSTSDRFFFRNQILHLNAVQLKLNGRIISNEEGCLFDLHVESREDSLKSLLSLIPALSDSSCSRFKSDGRYSFFANVNGMYKGDQYPTLSFKLKVENGAFQKPGLAAAVSNIFVDAGVTKPQGPMDSTVIQVSRFHIETGRDSANGTLLVTTPASNANIHAQLTGNFDLSTLSQFYSTGGAKELSGSVNANLKFEGRKRDIDLKSYKSIHASGSVTAANVIYHVKNLSAPVQIKEAGFTVHSDFISMDRLNGNIGHSDFTGTGKLENVIGFISHQGRLTGVINMKSDTISVLDFVNKPASVEASKQKGNPEKPNAQSDNAKPNAVPDFQIAIITTANLVYYDRLSLQKVNGRIEVDGHGVTVNNLTANAFGGSAIINAHSGNLKDGLADASFQLRILNMDIQKVYQAMPEDTKSSPWLQHISGSFSGNLEGSGKMKPDLNMDSKTLCVYGRLKIPDLKIDDMPVLIEIGQLAKVKSLDHLEAKNVSSVFTYKNGKTSVDSTDIKFTSGYGINFKGVSNADQTVDADIALDVPVREFGSVASLAQNLLSGFMKVPENVQFKFKVTGNSKKPVVKLAGVSTPVN